MEKLDAYDILECITEWMDLVFRATEYPWRLRICPASYHALKEFEASSRPEWLGELFYEKDGHEYIRAIHNETIPFILHYRVVLDESLIGGSNYGTAVEMDDEIEPDVLERSNRNWNEKVVNNRRRVVPKPDGKQ